MGNKEVILSICISSYNRVERTERIVKNILSCPSEKFNIIVVDDCSYDDTVKRLELIGDSRLRIYKNVKNLGAMQNWYETIEHGDGKYILHVLDRDWLDVAYIEKVIEILENNDVGFGYIGNYTSKNNNEKSKSIVAIYDKGEEALCEFACTIVHPTGFLVKKECWKIIDIRRVFFDTTEYGIYPHSYIYALLGKYERAIAIRYKMFETSNHSDMGKNLSRFYQKNILSYWWTIESCEYETASIIKFICSNNDYEIELKKAILISRFKDMIYRSTLLYKKHAMNIVNAKHYNTSVKYISNEELLEINENYKKFFINCIMKSEEEICDEIFLQKINFLAIENEKIISDDGNWKKREKQIVMYSQFYHVMDAWVELYQKGIRVSDVLYNQGIRSVAIYGNGKLGKRIYKELINSSVEVKYIIDNNAKKFLMDIPVYSINSKLPKIDLIIVTVIQEYENIKKQLSKVCNYTIKSLEDIIYASFDY